MITYSSLKETPDVFERLTGISVGDFDDLHQALVPVWNNREQKRLGHANRQRAVGGGRSYALRLRDQLLMTLVWLHLSLSTQALGCLFSVGKSTASRNTRRVVDALRALRALRALDPIAIKLPEPPKRGQTKTLKHVLQAHPELLAFVDDGGGPAPVKPLPAQSKAREPAVALVRQIGQIEPFQNLTPRALDALRQAAHRRRLERHAFLFHQGDPAKFFYILLKGQIRLSEVTPDGHQVLVRFVGSDEAIGLIAALKSSVYPLSAQALEACRLLSWDSDTLERLMEQYPRIAINGIRLVSQRWHDMEQRYRELATERVHCTTVRRDTTVNPLAPRRSV